jgi:WD40 repeat protein
VLGNTLLTNTKVLGNTLLGNTQVLGNTLLTNTQVLGNTPVLGNTLLTNAPVLGNTLLTNTKVLGNTLLGNTPVLGNTLLTNTKVLGNTLLTNAPVLGNTLLTNTKVLGNTLLGNTQVLGNTLLTNTKVLGNTLLTNAPVLGNTPVLGNKLDFHNARTDAILIAHKSPIVCLAINGYLVATASAYGTHIHIYDMLKKTQIHKLRRGFTSSNINGLLFSCDSTFIICYTDFSIHRFNLTTPEKKHISYEFELPLNMKISWLDNNNLEFIILYNGCNTISNTISNKNSKYFWKSMKIIDDVFTLTGFGHLLKPDIYDLFRINTSL